MSFVYLVRHGLTDFNEARRFAGCTDIKLSERGSDQVIRLRERLSGESIDVIYTSDLARAVTTAEAIAAGRNGLKIVRTPDLREMDYGSCEGLTFAQIAENYPDVALKMRERGLSLRFPRGEGFEEMKIRVDRFLQRLRAHGNDDTIVVVSHSGPLRTLVCSLLEVDLQHWWQFNIENASLSIVRLFAKIAVLDRLNDISHLEGLENG